LGADLIDTIYFEEDVGEHPRTLSILDRFKSARAIPIKRFGEIFNRRGQNFRIQKSNPSLILAGKYNGHVLPAPDGFGIGGTKNFYFSHMYNCVYDCRYCFLQGMFASANYVLFVNFEDFDQEISRTIKENPNENITFFSGYDCDSLALENITGFAGHILPIFKNHPNSLLEFRTKSVQVNPLMSMAAIPNCVIAYSLMPEAISVKLDNKAPSIKRRIETMSSLARQGWKIGLRFDPLIHGKNWQKLYQGLIEDVFKAIPQHSIHSVSFGPLRFPKAMYRDIFKLYPEEPLFSGPLDHERPVVAYKKEIEEEMTEFCQQMFAKFIPGSIIFRCITEGQAPGLQKNEG
jgi:spore photoproduct lyase